MTGNVLGIMGESTGLQTSPREGQGMLFRKQVWEAINTDEKIKYGVDKGPEDLIKRTQAALD